MFNDFHWQQLVHKSTNDNHRSFVLTQLRVTSVSVIPGIFDYEAVASCFNMKSLWYQNSSYSIYLYHRGDFDSIRQYIHVTFQHFLSSEPLNKLWTNLFLKNKCSHLTTFHGKTVQLSSKLNDANDFTIYPEDHKLRKSCYKIKNEIKRSQQLIIITNANHLTMTLTTPLKSFGNISRV